jgi:hypothetical protein
MTVDVTNEDGKSNTISGTVNLDLLLPFSSTLLLADVAFPST